MTWNNSGSSSEPTADSSPRSEWKLWENKEKLMDSIVGREVWKLVR